MLQTHSFIKVKVTLTRQVQRKTEGEEKEEREEKEEEGEEGEKEGR